MRRNSFFVLLSTLSVICVLSFTSAQAASVPLIGTKPAQASTTVEIPEELTPEQIDALLARVTDAEARRLLAAELHQRAEANKKAERTAHGGFAVALVELRKGLEAFTTELHGYVEQLSQGYASLPRVLPEAFSNLGADVGLAVQFRDLLFFLIIGIFAQWMVRRWLRPIRARIESVEIDGLGLRVGCAAARLVADMIPLIAFAVATLGFAAVYYETDAPARNLVIAYLTGALIILIVRVASKFVLAPYAPPLRLAPLGDAGARFTDRWIMIITVCGTLLWLSVGLIILTGVPMPAHLAIVVTSGAAMVALVVPMIWSCREGVAAVIRGLNPAGAEGNSLRGQIADTWHWLAVGYLCVVYLMWSLNMLARSPTAIWAAIGSVLLVFALPLLDRAVAHAIAGFFRLKSEISGEAMLADSGRSQESREAELPDGEQDDVAEQRRHFAAVAQTSARIVYGTLAAVLLLQLWGLNIIGLAGPDAEVAFWTAMLEVSITLVVAVLIWRLTKSFIDPRIPDTPLIVGDEGHSAPRTRAETLYPLLRTSILVLLVVFTFMISLANLGVEIGPLLAGAGVIGLAIGFGAQTLVKDIVSGIFFLIDDAFRVGEYIEFGDLRGEVEAISLRSLKLRHHRGAVHTVPFGELRSITNYSRDWVIYKMEFRLPVGTDVEKVRKLIKKIGQELLEHPEHGDKFLQPLKSQGINRMEENALILRTKFMCKPREQFMIRRDAFRRIAEVFAENGIQFAPRTVSVTGGDGVQAGGASGAVATGEAAVPPKQALE